MPDHDIYKQWHIQRRRTAVRVICAIQLRMIQDGTTMTSQNSLQKPCREIQRAIVLYIKHRESETPNGHHRLIKNMAIFSPSTSSTPSIHKTESLTRPSIIVASFASFSSWFAAEGCRMLQTGTAQDRLPRNSLRQTYSEGR